MAKLAILITEGFEEIEALAVVDLCRRAKIEIIMVSISDKLQITGSHNISVICDETFETVDVAEYDGVVLPGGPGHVNLLNHIGVITLVKDFYAKGKLVAAICAAPTILAGI